MFQPDTIVTVDPYRRYLWHRDHRITGLVTLDAVFPYARDVLSYPDLLEQGLLPHKVKEVLLWGAEDLNCRFDITDTLDVKIAALLCHKSQVGDKPSPQLRQWLIERAREMAKGEDFELAEAFHRVEIVW
jgi:LmbE family N-acetylglucosaminyl deacetylase